MGHPRLRFGGLMASVLLTLGLLVRSEPAPAGDGASQDVVRALDELRARVQSLEDENRELKAAVRDLQKDQPLAPTPAPASALPAAPPPRDVPSLFDRSDVRISGEGGVAYFDTGAEGAYPNNEFRVDEARIFTDARLLQDIYLFMEVNAVQREEADNLNIELGELYLDFENAGGGAVPEGLLNVRAGRFDVPFGEEYLWRDAIDNVLISHSLSDIWGVDEGLALHGRLSILDYVLALQNGGHPSTFDGDSDKAVVARFRASPRTWLRLSLSLMRTGDLSTEKDEWSELWFGNAFIRALKDPELTTTFEANLAEGDARLQWKRGYLAGALGAIDYSDNHPDGGTDRDVLYYYVEASQDLLAKLYAASRFSQIVADDGFPIVGQGPFGNFFSDALVEEIWRLSLGLGYRLDRHLLLKAEYSFERGEETDGAELEDRDQIAAEAAFSF